MNNQREPVTSQGRLLVIDRLKGICLFLMLFLEGMGFFRAFGPLYRIAADPRKERADIVPGLQFGDCLLPLFLFLIGMSCYLSYTRRSAVDKKGALRHLVVRYGIFAALGSCLVSLEYLMNGDRDAIPGTQAICVACLVLGIAYIVFTALRKKMKRGELIANVCKIGFVITCITLILLDLPLMLSDMWDQLFYVDGTFTFYENAFMHWSILHVFAYAGLVSILFIVMKRRARVIAWFALFALRFGLQSIPFLQDRRDELVMGGPWGVFGWTLCLTAGFALCEAYVHSKHPRLLCTLTFLITSGAAAALTVLQPISSRGVSVNFILLTGALFTALLFLVSLFDRVTPRFDFLTLWGRNPILVFILGLAFKIVLLLWLPLDEPLWVGITFMGACAVILFGFTVWLNKSGRKIHI